jgi:tail protein P2 I
MITSRYLDHLPATFAAGDPTDPAADAGFVGRLLLAFERVLTGLPETTRLSAPVAAGATRLEVQGTAGFPPSGLVALDWGVRDGAGADLGEQRAYTVVDGDTLDLDAALGQAHQAGAFVRLVTPIGIEPRPMGIEALLDRIQVFFDPGPGLSVDPNDAPARAPDDFLPWLASWVATSLRDDWSSETKRAFIRRVVSLYRKRGTRDSVKMMLRLYLGNGDESRFGDQDITLHDSEPEVPDKPHYFTVRFHGPTGDRARDLALRYNTARAILDQEKPAHTYYALAIDYPSLQIDNSGVNDPTQTKGVWVGVNTVLGTVREPG